MRKRLIHKNWLRRVRCSCTYTKCLLIRGPRGAVPPVYTYVGCYTDGYGPYTIDGNTRTFPARFGGNGVSVDECAVAARDGGYTVFALQYYGQCFLGSMMDVAELNAASQRIADSMCLNVPCVLPDEDCSGWINKVFSLEGVPRFPSRTYSRLDRKVHVRHRRIMNLHYCSIRPLRKFPKCHCVSNLEGGCGLLG